MSDQVRDGVNGESSWIAMEDAAITLYEEAEQHASALLRQRLVTRLATSILLDLKADGPLPTPSTEQQARAMMKALGDHLHEAAQALFTAAERMKHKGDGVGANQAYTAAMRTKDASQGTR